MITELDFARPYTVLIWNRVVWFESAKIYNEVTKLYDGVAVRTNGSKMNFGVQILGISIRNSHTLSNNFNVIWTEVMTALKATELVSKHVLQEEVVTLYIGA